jgi:hypothetical protein
MIVMKEFNKELTVLVVSCDAYNDVACNFSKLVSEVVFGK